MKKIIILLFALLLFVSGCGQPKYESKTIKYLDESNGDKDVTVWYEVPQEWDCADEDAKSIFIPNANDEVWIGYPGSVETMDSSRSLLELFGNSNQITVSKEEYDANDRHYIKYTLHDNSNNTYTYGYFTMIKNAYWEYIIRIQTSDLKTSTNPYDAAMKHMVETVKAL